MIRRKVCIFVRNARRKSNKLLHKKLFGREIKKERK